MNRDARLLPLFALSARGRNSTARASAHGAATRRGVSKSGACILTSRFPGPIAQPSRSTFAVSFFKQEIELAAGSVVLHLPGPSRVVLFQNERGQLGQFLRRQFANSALDFREAHLVN